SGSEVDDHAAIGVGAVTLWDALEVGNVEHLPLALACLIVLLWIDEQLTTEEVLPGRGSGHLDGQVVGLGRAYMDMGNEVILGLVEGFDTVPERIELLRRERAIDRTPGNIVLAAWLFDDETVNGRATGTMPSPDDQRAIGGQLAFAALDGLFNQLSGADIDVHGVGGLRHEFPVGSGPIPPCCCSPPNSGLHRKKWARL